MLKWFPKADKGLDVAVRWAGLWGGMTAAFTWLNKNVSWFGHLNWAEALLLAIAFALATMLALSVALAVGAYGFRIFDQVRHPIHDGPAVAPLQYDDTALSARVDELVRMVRTVIDDYQRMSALEARFGSDLDGFKLASQKDKERIDMNVQMAERKINEALFLAPKVEAIRVDTETSKRDLKALL